MKWREVCKKVKVVEGGDVGDDIGDKFIVVEVKFEEVDLEVECEKKVRNFKKKLK